MLFAIEPLRKHGIGFKEGIKCFEAFDGDKRDLVDALEMIAALAMISSMSNAETLAFIFNLYDLKRSGLLSMVEISLLVEYSLVGYCKLTGLYCPNESEIDSFTSAIFDSIGTSKDEYSDVVDEMYGVNSAGDDQYKRCITPSQFVKASVKMRVVKNWMRVSQRAAEKTSVEEEAPILFDTAGGEGLLESRSVPTTVGRVRGVRESARMEIEEEAKKEEAVAQVQRKEEAERKEIEKIAKKEAKKEARKEARKEAKKEAKMEAKIEAEAKEAEAKVRKEAGEEAGAVKQKLKGKEGKEGKERKEGKVDLKRATR
jgi:hypothetical protein